MTEFSEKFFKQEQEVKFSTCPQCRLAVRLDDANHVNECHGRTRKRVKDKEGEKEIKQEEQPMMKNPPGKRATRKAEARMLREKSSIPSSWKTEGAKKIRSIILTPFESNRRKH